MHFQLILRAFCLILLFGLGVSAHASPLQTGTWTQIARMADGDAGVFDGNGDLLPTYSFGTFTSANQATDFQVTYDVYAGMKILFITGDELVWGQASYSDLRTLIDAKQGTFSPNITFDASIFGVASTTTGNVLSRLMGPVEDPWISLSGSHFDGVASGLILWGEGDYPAYTAFKNAHGGINVYVTVETIETPVPAALPLFASALIGGAYMSWRRRKASMAA